ncbi:FAD-binding protein [Candidatus Beckwithbacteria bacterium]|nr:FAD-binding protein [Candidatus Beckwithbacteria bacterium]
MNLKQYLPEIKENEPLAPYTTIRVGGSAQYLYVAKTRIDLIKAVEIAKQLDLSYFILGAGSNLVFPDTGFKGLVIKNEVNNFKLIDQEFSEEELNSISPRLKQLDNAKYDIKNLGVSFDKTTQKVYFQVGSGTRLNILIQQCLDRGFTGLEWFAGIPGTVGGACFMNIHGGDFFFSDFVMEVEVLEEDGSIKVYKNKDLKFAYDYSIFHENKKVILNLILRFYKGNSDIARNTYSNWVSKKIINQPQNSAGCIWQNLSEKEQQDHFLASCSIGYIIDQVLGLKGIKIGQAQISLKHAGFIENLGKATSKDVLSLVELVENKFLDKFGFALKREVIFL